MIAFMCANRLDGFLINTHIYRIQKHDILILIITLPQIDKLMEALQQTLASATSSSKLSQTVRYFKKSITIKISSSTTIKYRKRKEKKGKRTRPPVLLQGAGEKEWQLLNLVTGSQTSS